MIRELVDELLLDKQITVGFVGINQAIVDKWSSILRREFADLGMQILAKTLDEIQQNPEAAAQELQPTCCVLTLVSTWSDVRSLLPDERFKISAVLSELSTATHKELANLPPSGPVGLICRDFYVNSILAILSAYIDLARVLQVSPYDDNGMRRVFSQADVVVHTLAAAERVVPLAKPGTRLVELEYVPNRAAVGLLRQRLASEATSAGGSSTS
ncbi:hypothetical protein ACFLUM_01295 [Chloroflexota bacterium]